MAKRYSINTIWYILFVLAISQMVFATAILSPENKLSVYLFCISLVLLSCLVILFFILKKTGRLFNKTLENIFHFIKPNPDINTTTIFSTQKQLNSFIEQVNTILESFFKKHISEIENLRSENNNLITSNEKHKRLIESLSEEFFFYSMQPNGELKYISDSAEKILGYSADELGAFIDSISTKKDINTKAAIARKEVVSKAVQQKYLLEVLGKDKTPHMLEITDIPSIGKNGKVESVEGIVHDISDAYYMQEQLREQEEKYRQIFDFASDLIFIYEFDSEGKPGKFVEANQHTYKVLGYSPNELKKLAPTDLTAAEIWTEKHVPKSDEIYEQIWETKLGRVINIEISEHYYIQNNKKFGIAVARDISERKKALDEIIFMNEELINQKENLETLIDNLTQTQEQLVQSEKMAALGQLIAGVAHEINTPLGAIKASVGNLDDSLNSALKSLPSLFQNQSKESLDLFLKAFKLASVKKPEISSREKREQRRENRQKLKEQNIESPEIVADILGYLEIYEEVDQLYDLLKFKDAIQVLNNVREFISLVKNTRTISLASDKASTVVFALKKYAHRDSLGEKVPTDIIDGIETVLTLYDNQLKQGIEVVKNFNTLPTVMCYRDEINQVWTNLIQNAIHAMKLNGKLTIAARSEEKLIEVSISDTGEGIEPTIIDKIFDPFFTTKKQGEGSGMGLDIVKKIIDKHGGDIGVISEIGIGTTFKVTIPIA
ncbi:MAG: PAS domain S-box protein [Bacteroidales bacterium]|nr:PAS domain S-box protein [Bacteroidales bacterium]